jgi:hypothetical protein
MLACLGPLDGIHPGPMLCCAAKARRDQHSMALSCKQAIILLHTFIPRHLSCDLFLVRLIQSLLGCLQL